MTKRACLLAAVIVGLLLLLALQRRADLSQSGSQLRMGAVEQSRLLADPGDNPKGLVYLDDREQLEPVFTKTFVASFAFIAEGQSPADSVWKLMGKYASKDRPYPGWALALKLEAERMRPRVYWKGNNGRGTWFEFADSAYQLGHKYAVHLVASCGDYISVYLEDLGVVNSLRLDPGDSLVQTNDLSSPAAPEIEFVGGFRVRDIDCVNTRGNFFYLRLAQAGELRLFGLSELLVATLDRQYLDRNSLLDLIRRGPVAMREHLPGHEIAIWLGPENLLQGRS